MDLRERLDLAWQHLDAADRDEVVALAEDLAADRQSWWNAQTRHAVDDARESIQAATVDSDHTGVRPT